MEKKNDDTGYLLTFDFRKGTKQLCDFTDGNGVGEDCDERLDATKNIKWVRYMNKKIFDGVV
jgi:hypothetical protein